MLLLYLFTLGGSADVPERKAALLGVQPLEHGLGNGEQALGLFLHGWQVEVGAPAGIGHDAEPLRLPGVMGTLGITFSASSLRGTDELTALGSESPKTTTTVSVSGLGISYAAPCLSFATVLGRTGFRRHS